MIAYRFSAGNGLVLELKYSFSQFPLKAKYFDCAFFSDYVSEKECLFIGGLQDFEFKSIRDIPTNTIQSF